MSPKRLPLPLLMPGIFFTLGIIAQAFMHYRFEYLLFLVALELFLVLCLQKYQFSTSAPLFKNILFFCIGGATFSLHQTYHLLQEDYIAQGIFDVQAQVIDVSTERQGRIKETLLLSVMKSKVAGENFYRSSPSFTIECYLNVPTHLEVGDRIEVSALKLSCPPHATSSSPASSFKAYLQKEDIACTAFLQELPFTLLNRPYVNFRRFIHHTKHRLLESLRTKLSNITFILFACIFLGYKKPLKKLALKDNFNFWGISHYLVRSGLHVVIILMMLTMVLRVVPVNLTAKYCLVILFSVVYWLLSWSSISFIRAFLLSLFVYMGKIFGEQTHFLHLLSVVFLLILFFNPYQLFFLDFQLSFLLTAALSWISQYK